MRTLILTTLAFLSRHRRMLNWRTCLQNHRFIPRRPFTVAEIVNSHTTESIEKKVLDFRINHRFGDISQGYDNFYGLDNATMRMSFDYGITDDITIGIGRSTFNKTVDGFAKYRFLKQIDENGNMPISAAYIAGISMDGSEPPAGRTNYFTSRLAYLHQLVIARKFSNSFSAQLMPTIVHRNLIDSPNTLTTYSPWELDCDRKYYPQSP